MKNLVVFKKLFNKPHITDILQAEISKGYDLQARKFQNDYNDKQTQNHIWRHALYKRSICFQRDGMKLPVTIEIIRFIVAGTSKTFTFYGNILIPYLRFAREFIKTALSSPSDTALEVSEETLQRWVSSSVLEYIQYEPVFNTA